MQNVINTGLATYRSGTYADRVVRVAMYTFGGLATTYLWAKDAESSFWTSIALPFAKRMHFDEEYMHRKAITWLSYGRGPFDYSRIPASMNLQVFGKTLGHPICLGAGMDRDAEAVYAMYGLGFSGIEIGSVTPQKQAGSGFPRVFQLYQDNAIVHRMGYPSRGMAVVSYFLDRYRMWEIESGFPAHNHLLGVSIGRNRITDDIADDARIGIRVMGETADYIAIALNQPEKVGSRVIKSKEWLEDLVNSCHSTRQKLPAERQKPILYKVPADLTPEDVDDLVDVSLKHKVDGLIISGGTLDRPGLSAFHYLARQPGQLSGEPLKEKSTELLRTIYQKTGGKVMLVGSGGVMNGQDALDKIEAGATLVQLYSAMVFNGPGAAAKVKKELSLLLEERGYRSVTDAIGAAAKA